MALANSLGFRIALCSLLALPLVTVAIADAAFVPSEESKREFRAGAATSNITPWLGDGIVGGFDTPAAKHIHDELHARCLVLDDGQTRLAIVLCDNVGIAREVLDEAKRLAHEATGLAIEHMLVAATHTHSATSARWTNPMVPDKQVGEYHQFLSRRIADGIRRAINNLEPAKIGWGVAEEPNEVFNRRWHMKPGTPLPNPFGGFDQVLMNPPAGSPNLVKPAGPIDPQIVFLSVQSVTGRPIALLANYSLHYVGGTRGPEISADYFAMFADRIQQLLGADRLDPPFVGIMSNGTSGDINNIDFRTPRERMEPYQKMRHVANVVAEKVFAAHERVGFHDWVPLAAAQRDVKLAVRRPSSELVERAKEIVSRSDKEKPAHPREVIYARRTLQLAEAPETVDVPLQALRIGEVGIAAIPFEVFVETGLEIKQKSPFKPTFTIELANGSFGYLPTVAQHKLGGYETWLGTNRVEIEAEPKIVETVIELLSEVEPRRSASR